MNTKQIWLTAVILIAAQLFSSSTLLAEQTLTVQVKETKLRVAPTQWSNSVSTLKYGDSVEAIKVEKDWVEALSSSKKKGYVHASAMSSKKVILSSSRSTGSELDPTDVILAGKGFSRATEDEYTKVNPASDFRAVNSVEALNVSDSELKSFMREGKVGEGVK